MVLVSVVGGVFGGVVVCVIGGFFGGGWVIVVKKFFKDSDLLDKLWWVVVYMMEKFELV